MEAYPSINGAEIRPHVKFKMADSAKTSQKW